MIKHLRQIAFTGLIIYVQIHAQSVMSGVLFEENFDDQPDWTSDLPESLNYEYHEDVTLPDDWYAVRQNSEWDPSSGQPNNHESIEILSSNADKARGGTGKSYVGWRESRDLGKSIWHSEGLMMKYFPEGHDEIYVAFGCGFHLNGQ